MAKPKKPKKPKKKFVFLSVAEEEKFSDIAVYIWSGWTIGTDRTRKGFIYVGSTRNGSTGGQYGKSLLQDNNVKKPKRTYLHRFSKKDWLPSEYLKLNPDKKLFTTAGLRFYETQTIEASEKWFGEHIDINIYLVNDHRKSEPGRPKGRHAGCSKCRYTGCTKCCGVKLPTELPSIGKKAKKFLDKFRLLTCN